MTARASHTLSHNTSPETVRASVREANARLEQAGRGIDDIAADLGSLMADVAFAGLDRLEHDHRRFRERFSIGERK